MLSEIRRPFDDYAPAEQAPLAGYGAAMLAYAAALSLAFSLVGRSRTRPGFGDVALLGIGTHKLSRLITKDFVTAPLRAPFTRRKENEGAGEVRDAAAHEEAGAAGWCARPSAICSRARIASASGSRRG